MKFATGHQTPNTIVVLEEEEAKSLINNATQVRPRERKWLLDALEAWSKSDHKVIMTLTEYLEMIGRR